MGGFHVRRNGVSIAVADLAALRSLARSGGLSAHDEVRPEDGAWVPAGSMPALADVLGPPAAPTSRRTTQDGGAGDPWSAWQDVDAVDAASLYREVTEQGVEELPAEALAPVSATPGLLQPEDITALPEDALTAADDAADVRTPVSARTAAPRVDRAADPSGQVIDFPRSTPRSPAPPPMMPDFARRERPERTTSAQTIRSAYMLVGTLVLALVGAAFLGAGPDVVQELDASATVGPPRRTNATQGTTPADDPLRKALAVTEAELRARMPPVPRPIKEPGALGDALMLEMSQLGVNITSVDATVVKYVGRKQDEPKTVELRVSYVPGARPSGADPVAEQAAVARDVGAIALVVGRYVRVYRLEVPILELTDMSTLSKGLLASTQAEAWYLGRLPLPRLMESVQRP